MGHSFLIGFWDDEARSRYGLRGLNECLKDGFRRDVRAQLVGQSRFGMLLQKRGFP